MKPVILHTFTRVKWVNIIKHKGTGHIISPQKYEPLLPLRLPCIGSFVSPASSHPHSHSYARFNRNCSRFRISAYAVPSPNHQLSPSLNTLTFDFHPSDLNASTASSGTSLISLTRSNVPFTRSYEAQHHMALLRCSFVIQLECYVIDVRLWSGSPQCPEHLTQS